MNTGYKVGEIMTTAPIKCDKNLTVVEIAKLMKEKNVGSLLIIEAGKLAGIVTEKDLVVRALAENIDASKVTVANIMSPLNKIVSIEPGEDLYKALITMNENDVRRLPVMSNGELKGLITLKDILKIEPALFDITVENIRIREEDRKLNATQFDEEDEPFEED